MSTVQKGFSEIREKQLSYLMVTLSSIDQNPLFCSKNRVICVLRLVSLSAHCVPGAERDPDQGPTWPSQGDLQLQRTAGRAHGGGPCAGWEASLSVRQAVGSLRAWLQSSVGTKLPRLWGWH